MALRGILIEIESAGKMTMLLAQKCDVGISDINL
jgi:hypothetical protein